jgi:hypothetical protein
VPAQSQAVSMTSTRPPSVRNLVHPNWPFPRTATLCSPVSKASHRSMSKPTTGAPIRHDRGSVWLAERRRSEHSSRIHCWGSRLTTSSSFKAGDAARPSQNENEKTGPSLAAVTSTRIRAGLSRQPHPAQLVRIAASTAAFTRTLVCNTGARPDRALPTELRVRAGQNGTVVLISDATSDTRAKAAQRC